ncbi:hypothetical protein ACFL54_08295 [Planctomycetota bacterium]
MAEEDYTSGYLEDGSPIGFILDPECLTPTLTKVDDIQGFDRPWHPLSLAMAVFFAGLAGGGPLLVINFKRLGMPKAFKWSVPVVIFAFLLQAGVLVSIVSLSREQREYMPLVFRIYEVAVALSLAAFQKKRYNLFRKSDQKAGTWKIILPFIIVMYFAKGRILIFLAVFLVKLFFSF